MTSPRTAPPLARNAASSIAQKQRPPVAEAADAAELAKQVKLVAGEILSLRALWTACRVVSALPQNTMWAVDVRLLRHDAGTYAAPAQGGR